MARYKYCIVPKCKNTLVKYPDKLFISLPSDLALRKVWQQAMGRIKFVSPKGTHFCCEDHFDPEDIENYMYLKTMKPGRILLRPGTIPHRFECQARGAPQNQHKTRRTAKDFHFSEDTVDNSTQTMRGIDKSVQVKVYRDQKNQSTQTFL